MRFYVIFVGTTGIIVNTYKDFISVVAVFLPFAESFLIQSDRVYTRPSKWNVLSNHTIVWCIFPIFVHKATCCIQLRKLKLPSERLLEENTIDAYFSINEKFLFHLCYIRLRVPHLCVYVYVYCVSRYSLFFFFELSLERLLQVYHLKYQI